MDPKDPQFLYMVLILPSLFGFTLVGEGLHRVMHAQMTGIVSIVMGMGFIVAVGVAYMMLSGLI